MSESAQLAEAQRSALYRRRSIMASGLSTAVAAAVKGKASAAILAALLAAGGTTGATVAAANGAFGQQVQQQVQTCKDDLKAGTHGIGQCVSTFAQQKGEQERDQHSNGNAPSTSGKPSNPGNSGGHGQPTFVPGRPTGTPGRP
jgi:hypothetical protein